MRRDTVRPVLHRNLCLGAAYPEQPRHTRHVRDVHEAIRHFRRDVVARGRGRHRFAEHTRQGRDVADIRKAVVVDVGRPGVVRAVVSAAVERVGPDDALGGI